MKKPLLTYHYQRLLTLFHKFQSRLNKSFSSGKFKELSKLRQHKLIQRLEKLKSQLSRIENKLKYGSLAFAATAGIGMVSTEAMSQGVPAGQEFRVNTRTTGVQMNPRVAMDKDGDFVVTWTSRGQDDLTEYGIFAQRYNAKGVALGAEFQVNTYTAGRQNAPVIAMDDDGDFVIAWTSSGQDGSMGGVYFQRFNAIGQAQGSETQVNITTDGNQYTPGVAMDSDGDFAITWSGPNSPYSYDIFTRLFDASGAAKGGEIKVNTTKDGVQRFSSIAMDTEGDFVVSWQSDDKDSYGIFAQRFNAQGVAQGNEFRVNTNITNQQKATAVAMDGDGDFVIAWQSSGQDGSGDGIYAQRYNAFGVAQGAEFKANTYTTGSQSTPTVAINDAGEFIIAWISPQDGDGNGVYAQRYSANGATLGSEFKVNTYTAGAQVSPALAIDNDNDFIIAWNSDGQDGSSQGVYAQRFEENLAPKDILNVGINVNENLAANTSVDIFTTVDPDGEDISSFTYSLVSGNGGNDNNSFTIVSNRLQIKQSPDFETKSSYSVRVRSTDAGGLYIEKVFVITIVDINEAPTNITLSSTSVNENVAENSTIGTFSTTDPDAGNTFFYSLVAGTGDADNTSFEISGNKLKIIEIPDFETKSSYSIRVSSEDQGGLSHEQIFVITVNNLPETGIAQSAFSTSIQLYPNPAKGTVMMNLEGAVKVRIMDLSGHTIKESLVSDKIVNIDGIPSGIYMCEFTQNDKTGLKKLVIE